MSLKTTETRMKTASESAAPYNHRDGMTLIEVLVASVLVVLMGLGLFALGLNAQRMGEYSRCATEARGLANERMEELVSQGIEGLRSASLVYLRPDTNTSLRGYPIMRSTRLVWRLGNGTITNSTDGCYAEAHVDIVFWSPLVGRNTTNTYSTLIEE